MTEESPCANSNRQFVPSPTPEIVSSLTLTNNFVPLPSRERGFIFRNKLFNHSPVQLFNPPHPSPFTLHFTVCPLTLTLCHTAYSLTRLILRRFELASHKGRGDSFVANHSTIHPFNSSTLLTLHPSHFTLPSAPSP